VEGCGYMDWIGLAQDRDRWRTLVSALMNLRVPWNAGNFLTSCKPVSFSWRTLHRGVSELLITKYVFWFSLQILSETFFILRRNERDVVTIYMCGILFTYPILIKLEFFPKVFFSKYLIFKFYENPPSESRNVPCGRTDRHDQANSDFSQFCRTHLKVYGFRLKRFSFCNGLPRR